MIQVQSEEQVVVMGVGGEAPVEMVIWLRQQDLDISSRWAGQMLFFWTPTKGVHVFGPQEFCKNEERET